MGDIFGFKVGKGSTCGQYGWADPHVDSGSPVDSMGGRVHTWTVAVQFLIHHDPQ